MIAAGSICSGRFIFGCLNINQCFFLLFHFVNENSQVIFQPMETMAVAMAGSEMWGMGLTFITCR
jgi:hypothetical protein